MNFKTLKIAVRQLYKETFKLSLFYEGANTGWNTVDDIAVTVRSGNRIQIEESFLDPSGPNVGPAQLSVEWLPSIYFPEEKRSGA